MGRKLDQALAILNGVVGDHLARTKNGLATPMELIARDAPVALERDALARAYPDASPRVAVLVHGMMCTEAIWSFPDGGDYGAMLAADHGFTPLYVRYNTGCAIADSGAALARLLESVREAYPARIDEILLLGYSLGGLVARSACHVADQEKLAWLPLVQRAIYVGTPHLGAPLERVGRVVAKVLHAIDDPYTRLIGQIADLRSDGIKDLGDADLRHEDRERRRARIGLRDARHPVPLLPQIRHHLVAGSLSSEPWLGELFGDALVPVPSARNDGNIDGIPLERVKLVPGVSHLELPHHPEVYGHIRAWCEGRT